MDTKRLTGAFTAPIKESLLTASCAPAAAPSQGRSRETQRSEGSWRTGGTEAGEGRHHQLSSHFQPVGCNTALHSPDHLYKTPRKNSGILPFKICISPPRHTHRKKKKTNYSSHCLQDFHLLIILLYFPPTFAVCLLDRPGLVEVVGVDISCAVFTQTMWEEHCHNWALRQCHFSPLHQKGGAGDSGEELENSKTESCCPGKCQEIKLIMGLLMQQHFLEWEACTLEIQESQGK